MENVKILKLAKIIKIHKLLRKPADEGINVEKKSLEDQIFK